MSAKKNIIFHDFGKAVVWSFRLARETSPRLFYTIIGCFILESAIPVASTAVLGMLVAKLKDVAPGNTTAFHSLALWLGLAVFLLAMEFILTEIRAFSRQRLVDETGVNLQKQLYQHTVNMDLSFFEESEALNKLFRASGGSGGALGPIQSTLAGAAACVQIISLFGLMLYLQPMMAMLLFLAGIPLLVIRCLSALQKYELDLRTTQRRRLSRYYTSLLTGTDNVAAIKLLNLAAEVIARFEKTARSIVHDKSVVLKKISIRLGSSVILYMLVLVAVIGWLTYRFSLGSIAVGALVTFCLSAFRALKSNSQLSKAMATAAESALAIIPLLEFLAVKPAIADQGNVVPTSIKGRIELENVTFAYPHVRKPVIENLSLIIEPGQTVAVVGRNGAGKTTLVKLISRLYEIESGTIKIDDIETRDLSLNWLYSHIAMVFQKPTRFEASVHDNIAFGDWLRLHDKPEEVCSLAEITGLKNFVDNLPQGMETHLGRSFGEITLSAGQWQLLAISRAMARSNSILILDEPTSNLDTHFENYMFHAIRELAAKRTVIIISHRLSTVKAADRVLVLDAGRLVEDGTHDQLLSRSGFYADMVASQKDEVFFK